jgi:hypothetical protein
MSQFKLFEISSLLRDSLAAADEFINQETGEIPADWADFLDAVQMERDEKVLAVAAVIREKLAYAGTVKAEIDRLNKLLKPATTTAERLKSWLIATVHEGEKLKDSRVSISWRKSEAVVIDDESKLPDACFKIYREVSKTQVKEALAAGMEIAAHIEQKQNIQIK